MYVYVPLVYNPPPPLPPPPASLPLTVDQHADASPSAPSPSQGPPGSWDVFGSLSRILNYSSELCEKGIEKVSSEVKQAAHAYSDSVFRSYFRLPPEEEFLGEFWCRGISGGHIITVTIFLSTNYFGFLLEHQGQKETVMFPMRNIVSWQRAVQTRHHNGLPNFVVDTSASKFDAIQIYTDDFRMHVFYGFYHFTKFCQTFDSTWRVAKRFSGSLTHHQHRRCISDSSFQALKLKTQVQTEQSLSCTDPSDDGSLSSSHGNHTSDADTAFPIHSEGGTVPSAAVNLPNSPASARLLVAEQSHSHIKRKLRLECGVSVRKDSSYACHPKTNNHSYPKRSLSVDSATSTRPQVYRHRKHRRTHQQTPLNVPRHSRQRCRNLTCSNAENNTEPTPTSSSPPTISSLNINANIITTYSVYTLQPPEANQQAATPQQLQQFRPSADCNCPKDLMESTRHNSRKTKGKSTTKTAHEKLRPHPSCCQQPRQCTSPIRTKRLYHKRWRWRTQESGCLSDVEGADDEWEGSAMGRRPHESSGSTSSEASKCSGASADVSSCQSGSDDSNAERAHTTPNPSATLPSPESGVDKSSSVPALMPSPTPSQATDATNITQSVSKHMHLVGFLPDVPTTLPSLDAYQKDSESAPLETITGTGTATPQKCPAELEAKSRGKSKRRATTAPPTGSQHQHHINKNHHKATLHKANQEPHTTSPPNL
ncbi:hypothetical protein Pelo_5870 [Pelomyxa schiedti]|nr:hypothetical protein Pelo_5870 [Pelomyxa schiedti]